MSDVYANIEAVHLEEASRVVRVLDRTSDFQRRREKGYHRITPELMTIRETLNKVIELR